MDYRRLGLFLTGLLPTAAILLDSDPVNISGQWAVVYLLLTTGVTVGQKFFKVPAVKYRRQLGLWSAWFVLLHVSHYLIEGGISKALTEWTYDYQLIGWFSVVVLLALTLTSNKWAQKKLRANWASLHKLSYAVIGMGIIHGVIATKLGWFTMWPFAVIAVSLFYFKNNTAKIFAIVGVTVAYALAAVPEPQAPQLTPPVENEVIEPIERSDDVVSISCVNGKELVYFADGRRDYHADCSIDTSIYEIWDRSGFSNDLVTDGMYNDTEST